MGRIQRTRQDPPGGAQDLGIWGSGDLEIRGSASRVSRAETSCGNIGASLSRRVQQVAGEQTRPLCGNIPFYLVRSDLVDAACSALTRGVLSRDRQMIRIAAWFFHLVCARPQVWDPPCGIPLVGVGSTSRGGVAVHQTQTQAHWCLEHSRQAVAACTLLHTTSNIRINSAFRSWMRRWGRHGGVDVESVWPRPYSECTAIL